MMGGCLSPFRSGLLASAALVAIAAPSPAMAQVRSFNVPAQSASRGIPTFARQAGVQIIASGNVVRGRRTNAVRGSLTVDEGLRQLFAGTGLEASNGAGTGIITVRASGTEATPGSGEAQAAGAPADSEGANAGATPEILVIGTRPTLNVDIRRTEDDVQPYVVIGADEIAQSAAPNLDEFLRTRIPMNTQSTSQEQADAANFSSNEGRINLRGLGTNQTLILVDGRRVPGVSNGSEITQPNINAIPLASIERIEILPATAGAIYGGTATGGVINVILRRDYQGIDVDAQVSDTTRSDRRTVDLGARLGLNLADGRTRIMVTTRRFESESLAISDRDFVERSRALILRQNPAAVTRSAIPPLGATGNIRSLGGVNLVLDNGTPLNSPVTFVPVGYAGPASDGGAAFVGNAGRYNLDAPVDGSEILPQEVAYFLSASLRQELSSSIDLYGEVSWERRDRQSEISLSTAGFLIPFNSPSNPFQQNILVTYPLPSLPRLNRSIFEQARGNLGVVIRLPRNWSGGLDYNWGRSSSDVRGAPSRFIFGTSTTPALQAAALRDTNLLPPDLSSALLPTPNNFAGPAVNRIQEMTARLAGPITRLPAGQLTASGNIALREQDLDPSFLQDTNTSTGLLNPPRWLPARAQSTIAGYFEVVAPLVGESNRVPFIHELEVRGSVRWEAYRNRGPVAGTITVPSREGPFPNVRYYSSEFDSLDYSVGLKYSPVPWLMLRASYATGFLPPSLVQIAPSMTPSPAAFLNATDPRRGGEALRGNAVGQIDITSGGSVTLGPEQSRSLAFGIVVRPPIVPGLRLSADYVRIRKRDEIFGGLDPQYLISREEDFEGRVVRAAPLAADPAGFAGPIIGLDISAINISRTAVAAWDFQADLTVEDEQIGTIRPWIVATLATNFRRQIRPTDPIFDAVGYSDGGAPLRWRVNFGLSWERGPLTVAWSGQFYDSYYWSFADPRLIPSNAARILNQGSDRIRSQLYNDLSFRLRLADIPALARSPLAGAEVSLTVNNIFDARPPTLAPINDAAVGFVIGGYSTYGDPRLRRFTFGLRHSFGRRGSR